MNVIEKQNIDFNNLTRYDCLVHTESELFYDDDYMYKMFRTDKNTKSIYLLRKKVKLESLCDGQLLDNVILPNSVIMHNGSLSGYRMKFVKNAIPIYDFISEDKSFDSFFELMYDVSLTLRNIHNDPRNIVVGDFSISNIIFDEYMNHYFVDFDSVGIGNLPVDRVPFSLERYARRCSINKYNINKNTDRLCLLFTTLFTVFDKSIEFVSMREYDKMIEQCQMLKYIRDIVLEIKKYNSIIPEIPYLDEMVISCKKKIKNIR